MRRIAARPLLALLLLLSTPLAAGAAGAAGDDGLARLLRQPDIEGDTIVFVYAGDIWVVPASGGTAARLTSHPGLELFPKLSPDGKWIAFTGDYSGTRQVHVMPVAGGTPRQLTFYNDVGDLPPRGGIDNRIVDWTPDGKSIVFLPHRLPWGDRMATFYTVPVAGGMERPLEIPEAGGGDLSPDGTKIVYSPIEREFRTWKRYRGGRAQDVWIYDLANSTSEQITDFPGTDNQPVWVGDTIYFTSDRSHTLNLFAYDPRSKETTQVTRHDDFDVLWPSGGRDAVVYEAGGYIYRYTPGGEAQRVPIRLAGDFRETLPRFVNVTRNIESFDLSPSGVRALFEARGEIFTVPAEEGTVRNLTGTPGVRENDPAWSPDGRWVAYLSDRSGEYEVYVRPADGTGAERRLTSGGKSWRYAPTWSPDSRHLAFADRGARLWVVELGERGEGKVTEVDRGRFQDLADYAWSPDSRWLAYTKAGDSQLTSLWLHSLEQKKSFRLTDGTATDFGPVFDPQGRYLYFLSNRDFNPTFSGFEFEFVYTNPTRVYVGVLAADGPALFLPESDEEKVAEEGDADDDEEDEDGDDASATAAGDEDGEEPVRGAAAPVTPLQIDVAGFERRVRAIPGDPGNYRALSAVDKGVLYLVGDGGDTELRLYDVEEKEEKTVLAGINGYALSADGEKVLWRRGNGAGASFGVVDAAADQKTDEALDLAHLDAKVDPRREWAQEFVDAWRILRDWFYDPAMHGLDWQAMRRKYEPLVPHIAHRTDLDYVLGELGGELGAGHVYVASTDEWQPQRAENGLLGAEIESDPSGHFRIARIFPGENWHEDFRSPLTEPGVAAKAGELILAVDGVSTKGVDNFYRLLENRADVVVTLRLAADASGRGAHEERVRPIASETNLRYLDWVQSRRAYVEKASGGRIGYIHLPDTGGEGARELHKAFYPQAHKDALIFDARYNGGGFIPFYMIDLLSRPLLSYWARRDLEPFTTPGFYHRGPKAALINGYSSSGGDAFPFYFRERGLGKLYGTRTWGGLIGLSGNPGLMDGGAMLVPTFRFVDPATGLWAIEGEGVAPDVEVVDRPELVAKGQDPTLERAVKDLLLELEKNPPRPLVVPPPPVLGRFGEGAEPSTAPGD